MENKKWLKIPGKILIKIFVILLVVVDVYPILWMYESAAMDGCSDFRFFTKMVFPLSKPTFSSVIIYHALFSWNEYLFALTFLRSAKHRTITTATQVFFTQWQANWTQLFAILCIALIPIFILYVFLQKYFIAGMMAGAVKG